MTEVITLQIPAWVVWIFAATYALQGGLKLYQIYLQRKIEKLIAQGAKTNG